MKKLTAVIVEDEKGVRELLSLLIEKYCPDVEILGEAADIDTAFELISRVQPDVVFLDVHMPKGDGFELLDRFSSYDFSIIFTSSYTEYAVYAIKLNALDYLLKPYDREELCIAVEKAIVKKQLKAKKAPVEDIYIQVHQNDKVEQINAKNIVSLEAQDNYTLITTNDNQKYLVSKVLADLDEIVSPLNCFLRIHRSASINTNYIKNYSKVPPYTVKLINNTELEISRRKKTEVLEALRNK
jgi:two-component system LytT family response regulator